MLEDFIEANSLKAKIIPHQIRKAGGIKCELFFADQKPVLIIYPAVKEVSLEKVKAVLKCDDLIEADDVEAEDVTGYELDFLPPISIYDVKVLVDKKVMEKETAYAFVSKTETLEIPTKEINEFNEDFLEADIIQ